LDELWIYDDFNATRTVLTFLRVMLEFSSTVCSVRTSTLKCPIRSHQKTQTDSDKIEASIKYIGHANHRFSLICDDQYSLFSVTIYFGDKHWIQAINKQTHARARFEIILWLWHYKTIEVKNFLEKHKMVIATFCCSYIAAYKMWRCTFGRNNFAVTNLTFLRR